MNNLDEFMVGDIPPDPITKKCIACQEVKSLDKFGYRNITKDDGKEETLNTCKICKNKENKIIAQFKKYHPLPDSDYICPGCHLTEEQIKDRGGWKGHKRKKLTVWRLDHCHETNTFRDYMCDYCNNVLGRAKDNPDTLRRLADYVEYHQRKQNPILSQNNP